MPGCFAHLVEDGPDPTEVLAVLTAGEEDPRPGRDQQLGVGLALGRQEVARADHRRRHGGAVELRTGLDPVDVGCGVTGEHEGVAPLGQAQPKGNQPLPFDGPHLAAILFTLGLTLRHLVGAERELAAASRPCVVSRPTKPSAGHGSPSPAISGQTRSTKGRARHQG